MAQADRQLERTAAPPLRAEEGILEAAGEMNVEG
jgi:hypothetical protein